MKINSLYGFGPPKKPEKNSVEEIRERKVDKNGKSNSSKSGNQIDQVEISSQAKALHNSTDEMQNAKELLNQIPGIRADLVYEAMARVKSGYYNSEAVVEQAAEKLIQSGELNDIF